MIITYPYHLTLESLIKHANKHHYTLRGLDCFDLHHFAMMFYDTNGVYPSTNQLPTDNRQYYIELSNLS